MSDNQWEVAIRNALTGDTVWCTVIAFQVAVTDKGPIPITLYESDQGELSVCVGSPKIKQRELQ